MPEEEAIAPGLHPHFTRLFHIGAAEFGAGIGFEAIFDEHRHVTPSLNLTWFPTHALSFTAAPDLLFAEGDSQFSLHLETAYEFELGGDLHLGPNFEFAYARKSL